MEVSFIFRCIICIKEIQTILKRISAEMRKVMEYVLNTENLCKQYSKYLAVDNVSLHIKRGEIYGFIGKNGAGKTTFMKMICGLAFPTSGEIELFGAKGNAINRHRTRIGNLIEEPGIFPNLSGINNLKCKCYALGIYRKGYAEHLIEMVGLKDAGKKKARKYSLGMRQRLGIAMALAGEPDLLILDEPINGLDPQGIAEVRDMLLKLKTEKNMTIMISSHILEELYKIADTFGIINNGKLVQELSREELSNKCNDYIEIIVNDSAKACTNIEKLGFNDYSVMEDGSIHIYKELERLGEINRELVPSGCTVNSIKVVQENLENFFLNLTGGVQNA